MDTTTIIAIGAAAIGALLGGLIVHIQGRLRAIEREMAEMRALPKRHTHATAAGLEDAIAVLLDIQFKRDAETARLSQAMDILRTVRGGPLNYQQEKPAGRRPEGFED